MLYKKRFEEKLTNELFKNPTSEYRATPFWAWNCVLEKDELLRQIDVFKEMGLGGFHMHVRTGLATEYLSDEHMSYVHACVERAKENGMLAYLYDEDRWPSGAAGGIVTKGNNEYRQRMLRFTRTPYSGEVKDVIMFSENSTGRTEEGSFITAFDIIFDEGGYIKEYTRIPFDGEAKGKKWYAYLDYAPKTSWFNNQSYIDTMNKEAMDKFIEVTYETYLKTVGDEFDKTVPSIFTDEPQVSFKGRQPDAFCENDVTMPWTPDFPETFKARYGDDILESLPELFWNLADGSDSVARYRYHDHIGDRFSEAFGQNCGKWCQEHGIALTGHLMCEGSLGLQTLATSESMRNYRGFGIPGIDMLCCHREYSTAKQCQSAVHQFGSEGMMSELYGVTGWDFDFRGHKLHGDWQAALGVTLRVPHLSWVSMKGEAKRDYPASISYQSPWYSQYKRVEDHFARVNTALTRGKPIANIGVIHPIESYWFNWGCLEQNSDKTTEKDDNFHHITEWLVKSTVDFDFISEAMLPEQCEQGGNPLTVGKMAYDVIIVPQCETLRSTTLERLEAFKNAGGKLIFVGNAPKYENALPSNRGKALYDNSLRCSYTKNAIISAIEEDRNVVIRYSNGIGTDRYCHQLRDDSGVKWLFVAQANEPYNKHISKCDNVNITVKGEYTVKLYNTENGEITELPATVKNKKTVINATMYDYDSLLLQLVPGKSENEVILPKKEKKTAIPVPNVVDYTLTEPNCLLLDMAEYRFDDGEWQPKEEILRLDADLSVKAGLGNRGGHVPQPWAIGNIPDEHKVTLRFRINSEIPVKSAKFVTERLSESVIYVNGEKIESIPEGYYVDKAIETVSIPELHVGENIIEITLPFGKTCNTEWCYLIGDFGVKVIGQSKVITTLPEKLIFGDVTHQGLPFYGGNIIYHLPVKTKGGKVSITAPHYVGTLITVNNDKGIIYPPYKTEIELPAGESVIDLTLYGNRQNSFGHVHCADVKYTWVGPEAWRTQDSNWTYEYVLRQLGIISTPIIEE